MAIVEGVAMWASVTTPNTTFTPVYTVNLVVDEDVANDFRSRGFKVKDMDEGPALLIKRKLLARMVSLILHQSCWTETRSRSTPALVMVLRYGFSTKSGSPLGMVLSIVAWTSKLCKS